MRYQRNIKPNYNKTIITESQESKSISAAKKLLMKRLGYNEQQADEFIRIKLRGDITALRTPQGGKFILGVTRMFCDKELTNGNTISQLNTTLKYVASDTHINEYDRNLNGMSAQELIDKFASNVEMDLDNDRNKINSMQFNGISDYRIVRIDSFQQAREYGDYTSWCVTHDEYMYDSYTADGINQFYFCLKDNFETIPEKRTEGCPLDEYGLSMIAVLVNEKGMLVHCTCRWNHNNRANDNVMTTEEISNVIGMNFYKVFKPNNKWTETIEDAMQRLANGEKPETVFKWCRDYSDTDDISQVQLGKKYNFVNNKNEIISPNLWFDWNNYFNEGYAQVNIASKYNYVDTQGNLLWNKPLNEWFDDATLFINGFGYVNIKSKWNFIDKQGNILSTHLWFDDTMNFKEGFAPVEIEKKWNHIDTKGNIISPDLWFDWVNQFRNGFAIVGIDNKQNYINTQGKLISPDIYFYYCGDFDENGIARVQLLNGDYAYINAQGKFVENPVANEIFKVIETKRMQTYLTNIIREHIENFIRKDYIRKRNNKRK